MFAKLVGANLGEVSAPLDSFKSLSVFFTRPIHASLRPVSTQPFAVVSPSDGFIREMQIIERGHLIQAKGKRYSVSSLIADSNSSHDFEGGTAVTIYLAPKDYHRVHMPVTGVVTAVTVVPGALWPVNDWSLNRVPNLFSINERMVFYIRSSVGRAALVMVGATNVGAISTPLSALKSNNSFVDSLPFVARSPSSVNFETPIALNAGDHIGTFHLGSTVVLLLGKEFSDSKTSPASATQTSGQIRMGELIL